MEPSFFASISKVSLYILVIMLTGCSSLGLYHNEDLAPDKSTLYIAACSVLNSDFEIVRTLSSGYICLPLANGDWFDIIDGQLRYFSSIDGFIWKKHGRYHHQIKQIDADHIIVLNAVVKEIDSKLVKFDIVEKINIKTGQRTHQFSIYDELFLKKNLLETDFGTSEYFINIEPVYFPARFQHTHLNSISFYKNEIIISRIQDNPFKLTSNLEFKDFIMHDQYIKKSKNKLIHDFQILDDDSRLYFKNINIDLSDDRRTFKLFRVKNDQILFEFPQKIDEFVECDYSGGIEKMGAFYLFGFPNSPQKDSGSTVGLVDDSGHLIKKTKLSFFIQDVKRIPFKNFLEVNSVR